MPVILKRFLLAFVVIALVFPGSSEAQPLELQVEQIIEPTTIFTKSSGQSPDSASVKVLLRGQPAPTQPVDIVFLVDRSASVNLTTVKKIGKELLHHLHENDYVAVIGFAETAEMLLPLSPDRAQAYQIINEAQPGKKTALGEALALAIDELVAHGRPEALKAIVLPTDGNSLTGRSPLPEAQRAGENKIPIYAVGLSGAMNRVALSQIAQRSGGAFFGGYSAQVYEGILKKLGRYAVARFVRLRLTLPEQIMFEGAFEPTQVRRGAKGATVLEWNFPVVVTGEARTVSFQIGARASGAIELGPASIVEYRDANNKLKKQSIPSVVLTVNKVNKPPVAAFRFTPATPKIGDSVCFDASESRDPDGKIAQYAWDFDGDGIFDETTAEPRICRVFESGGNFTVTLRVADDDGATAEFTATVTINNGAMAMRVAIPIARFTFSPLAPSAGEPVTFDASASQSGNGEITQYEWDWNGDGIFDETVTTPTVQHTFSDAGPRAVKLRVTNSQGRIAEFSAIVTVLGRVPLGFDITALATASLTGEIALPSWVQYYTRDGRVTDEELKDAATRFGIGVYVPGTRYLLTQQDLEMLNHLNYSYKNFSRYRDLNAAQAEGYRPLVTFVSELGQVYLNEKILNAPLALATPPILLYDSAQRLVGVRYVAFKPDEGQLFGFSVERWPKVGEAFVLTIWLVPNPNGPFASNNPNVR
ncbi:MAG: PKD domain-containing protein [Candidatus Bipolaricaulota bacterium]|nr:PKD domain-containing protein [Candidatus Bipolaricaulota bacterium]